MAKIKNVKGRQVFDSRGNPTVEAEVHLDNGISATQFVHQERLLGLLRLMN